MDVQGTSDKEAKMGAEEEVRTDVAQSEIVNAQITPAKSHIDNGFGYGDFAFHMSVKPWARKLGLYPSRDQRMRQVSAHGRFMRNNTISNRLEPFTRVGTFPFLELPLEIQRSILGLLVKPFLKLIPHNNSSTEKGKDTRTGKFNISIGEVDTYKYNEKQILQLEVNVCDPARVESVEYSHVTTAQAWHLAHGYRLELTSSLATGYFSRTDVDSPLLTFLKNVAMVNKHFRLQMATILWANTHLSVDVIAFTDGALRLFLGERPNVCSKIRGLSVTWHTEVAVSQMMPICDYLAKMIELDEMIITIMQRESKMGWLDQERRGEEWQSFLQFRKIKVKTDVTVSLNIKMENIERNESPLDWRPKMQQKYQPLLREALLPDHLREGGQLRPKGDEETYLAGRM